MSGGRDEKRTQKGVHGALFLSLLFYSIANCYANVGVLKLEEYLMGDPLSDEQEEGPDNAL